MDQIDKKQRVEQLFQLIAGIDDPEDIKVLFEDLCTYKEVEQMAQRVKAARLLIEGKTYSKVIEETDISSATLSRVSRCVQYGGGYSKFLTQKN